MVLIKKATLEDAEDISKVHAKSWQTTYHEMVDDEFLKNFKWEDRVSKWESLLTEDDSRAVFAAVVDNHIIGFIAGGMIRTPVGFYDAELYSMYILKEHRRGNLGTKLFFKLIEWFQEMGFQSLLVWVAEKNVHQNFYRKLGANMTSYTDSHKAGKKDIHIIAYAWDNLEDISPPK